MKPIRLQRGTRKERSEADPWNAHRSVELWTEAGEAGHRSGERVLTLGTLEVGGRLLMRFGPQDPPCHSEADPKSTEPKELTDRGSERSTPSWSSLHAGAPHRKRTASGLLQGFQGVRTRYGPCMPLYEYELCEGNCAACGGRFTLRRPLSAPELTGCPACKRPIRKLLSAFNTPSITKPVSHSDAKKPGCTVLKRVGRVEYEPVSAENFCGIAGLRALPLGFGSCEQDVDRAEENDLPSPPCGTHLPRVCQEPGGRRDHARIAPQGGHRDRQ